MEYTIKDLVEILDIKPNNILKALKKTPYTLKKVEGSAKPVKHYNLEDLPQRYKEKIKPKKNEPDTNISKAKLSNKYLLASPEKKRAAILRCRLIEFYMKRSNELSAARWLDEVISNDIQFDEILPITQKQLFDWLKKFNDARAKGINVVEAFIDKRGAKKGVKALSDKQKEAAQRYFLKTSRPRISEIYRNMCFMFGDSMPSRDTLYAYFEEWKRKNPLLFEFSKSPDSAKNKYLVAYGDESAKAKYKNHYWELDSTPADVICDDGKRYSVIAAIDVFSRRAVFHVCESSSAYSISQLLRKAILKLGIPENVVIDNGRDYTSNHFETICLNLGINMNIVPPFSGECKPFVERLFGTLSRELFEQIPGYIGHDVAQRKELQARQSFADKIRAQEKWREQQKLKTEEEKKLWSDAWKIKKENIGLELSVLTSPDELQMWIDNWTDKMYEQRVHSTLKTKPILKWNRDTTPVQSIPDERMLCMLLGESITRKVGKRGIAYDGCDYVALELVELTGHYVYVMASQDLGVIYVFDENMQFICIAEDRSVLGQDRYLVRKAKKKSQALMKQMDKIVKEAQSINDPTILDRIEAVSDEIKGKTTAVTKRTNTVDALLRESPKIEAKDKEELEKSNRYDFKNKDEDGKPQKVLPSGRPAFTSFVERFIWDLENNMVDESTNNLANEYPELWEMAKKQAKVG
ncbi:DDE-type integrase/transposase/recombinase [Halarcobacter sp.]|uniref:DDE-type integrase/transposase/recombinase n=1 Tax=Halarcobacter sp. TaxID=2321133 RepID=UPI0029F5AED8|nr:DDE-type integrase/transposase/recombinase [Halarcobacter sp.]